MESDQDSTTTPRFSRSEQRTRQAKWVLCSSCGAPNARGASLCGVCSHYLKSDADETSSEPSNVDEISLDAKESLALRSSASIETLEEAYPTITDSEGDALSFIASLDHPADISSEEKDAEGWSCFVPGRHRRAAMALCALASRRLKRLHFATWKRRCLVLGEAQLTWECLDVIRRVEVLYKLYHAIRQHQRHVRVQAFSRLRRHAASAREHDQICMEKLQRALALRARAKLRFAFAKLSTAHIHLAQRVFRLCRCFAVFGRVHTRRMHAAFGQWKHLVLRAERCAQLSRTLCWSSKNYQRRSLRTAFARLRRMLEHGRMLERLHRLVKKRSCLQALDNLDKYRLKMTSLKRIILRSNRRQKLDTVDRWRMHTRRVVALSHIVRSQGQRIRREALRQLCAAARTRENQKKAIARVSIITRRTRAGAALREWARDTTLLFRVEQKRRRRLLTRCMLSWRKFVRVRTAAKAMQDKRTGARVSHIFRRWRTWARVNASRRMGHVIAKAFIGWTLYRRQSQAANERQVAQFLHRKRQRLLFKLLIQWKMAAKLGREVRHLVHVAAKQRALLTCLERFKGRTQNRLLAALHTWRARTTELTQIQKAERLRAACIVNVALARSRRVTQEAAFAKWHHSSIALPEKLQHLASESAKRLKKRVFRAWIDAVQRHQATVALLRDYFVPWKIAACLGSIERRRTERLISHLQFKKSKHSPHVSQHQHLQWQYRHQALTAAPSSHHYVHQRHVQLKEHQSEQDKTDAQHSSQGLRERRHLSARHVVTSTANDGEHDTQSAGIAFSEQGPGTDSEVSDDAGDSVETDRSHHSSRAKLLRRPIHAVHHSSGRGHSATRFESSPLSPPTQRESFLEDSYSVGSAPTPVLRAYFPHGSASARLRSRHLRYGFARAVWRQHKAQNTSDFNEPSVRGDSFAHLHPQQRMHSSISGTQSHAAHLRNLDGQQGDVEAKFPDYKASRRRRSATLLQQKKPDSSSSNSSVSSSQASFPTGNCRQIHAKHRVHDFQKASRQGSKNARLPENVEHRESRMKDRAEMFCASPSYSSPSSSLNDRSPQAYEDVSDVESESEMASFAVQGHQENRERSNVRFRSADESGVANPYKHTLRNFASRPDRTSRCGQSESDISDEDIKPSTNADQRKVNSQRIRQHHHRRLSQTGVNDDLHVASNESGSSYPVVGASAHFSRSSRRTCASKQLDNEVAESEDKVTRSAHRNSEGTNQAKSHHLGHERFADGRFEELTTEQDDFVDVIGKRRTVHVHKQDALPRRRGRNFSAHQSSKGINQAKSCHLGHERCADGQVERPTTEQDNVADVVGRHRTGRGQDASSRRGKRNASRHIYQSQQEQGNSHLYELEEDRNVIKLDAVSTEEESHEKRVHDLSATLMRPSRVRRGKHRDEEQQAELIDEVEDRWSQKRHQKEKDTGVTSQEDCGQLKTIFGKEKSKSALRNGEKKDYESGAESSHFTSDGDHFLSSRMECTFSSSEEEDHHGSQSVLMPDDNVPDARTNNVSRFDRSTDHSNSRKSKNRLRSAGERHASEGAHESSQTRERRTSSMSTQSCRHETDNFIERMKRRSSSSEKSKAAKTWEERKSVQSKRSGKYKSGPKRLDLIDSSNSQLYERTGAKSDIGHEARISFPSLQRNPVRHEKDDNERKYVTSSVVRTCWSTQEFPSSQKRADTRDRLRKPEKARSKQMSFRSFADRANHFQTGKLLQVNQVRELNAERSFSGTRYPSPVCIRPALREVWLESPTSSGLAHTFGDMHSPRSIMWGQSTDGGRLSLKGCNCILCDVAAFEHATLISVFAMWRQWVHRRRWAILRILWSLSGDGTRCANVASCFARWQVWTAKEREACTLHRKKSDSVCAALERITSARLACYWDHWVDLTRRPVLQDAQAVFVAREVLYVWKLNTLVSLRRKSLLQRQASRWKIRSLYQAWHLWSMHLSSVESLEANMLWADQSRLQDVFTAWRLVARDQANQARAYSLAHLASTFVRWRLARGVNAQKRAFVERAHFTTWKQRRNAQRLIRQRHAFDAWRGALHAQRGIRAGQRKLRLQFHRHRTEILRRTLLTLHRRVSSGRLAQSFRIWARWTARCTHTSRAAGRLVRSRILFALRCGWNALQAHARGSRLLQSMLLQARARGRVAAKREAFQHWKCLASVRSVEAWYTAEHMDASNSFQMVTSLALKQVEARELLAKTFASWKLWIKVNEATRRSCIWSQMTWMHWSWRLHTQKAAFQAWCAMVRRHKLLRNTMRHGTQRRKRLAFQRLRDIGVRARNVRRFVKLVYFCSHKLALRHFFSRWQRRADQLMRLEKARRYSRHMRVAKSMLSQTRFRVGLEICHRVYASSRSAQLARGWRALWVHARCRIVLTRVLWRRRRSALRQALGQWLRLQHTQKIFERYLWSLYRRTLDGAMVIWRRQAKIARHIESATCARRLERCRFLFQTWAARARRLRKHKTLMRGWHERRRSVRLGIFYRAWARYVSVSKIRRIARVRARILQVRISRLQHGLTKWKTYVTLLRSESERKNVEKLIRQRLACSIFQRAISRNDRTRTLMAFRFWRDRSFLAHSLKARFLFQVLRKTTFTRMQNKSFQIWASATSLSKRLDTLDAMLVTRRLRISFAQWESYAKKMSTYNSFRIQWRTAFLQKAFRGLLAAVQSQQRAKSHMRHVLRILHSQQSRRLASALSTWKAWAHQARFTSAVLRRAKNILQRWRLAKQGAAFTQWKMVHSRSTQILRRTVARFQGRGLRAAFSRLHEHARTQKLISRVMWRWSVRALRQAFSSWREREIEARVYAVKMQALGSAIRRWRHGLTRRTFAQWRSVVHAKKATLARACLLWKKHLLTQAFSRLWQCHTFDRVLCKAAGRWERRHLATAFRTWREVLAQRDVASLRIQRGCSALLRNRSRAKSAAFAHWASWSRKIRSILVNVLRRWAKRIARRGLIHLKLNAQRSRQLEKVLRRWRLRHLATAWQKCKASCLGAKHQAQVVRRLLARWHNQKLYLAFTTWSTKVTPCPARKELKRALLRWRIRLVRGAWARWRAAAQAVQQRRQVCAKVLQQWRTRCVRSAFCFWHGWVSKAALAQARLAVAKRVVLHWSLGPVRWAFARLAKHAHCMTLIHSAMQHIVQSRRSRVLRETWKKWIRTSDCAATANCLCKRIILRWRRRALVAAMSRWRSMSLRAKQVEHVFRKWNVACHTKLALGFQRWKTNACCVRRLMQRVVRIALLRGARSGFEALRSNARSLAHQKRAVRVMRRWLTRRSALAFRQWALYASAKAAAISAEGAALANAALVDEAARPLSAVLVQSVSMTESQRRWRSSSLLRCLARWQKKRLHAAWSLWRGCVRIQRDICARHEAMHRFLRRWKSRRAYAAFQILLRHARGASQLQTAEVARRRSLRVFVQRWKTQHKRAAFSQLKAYAASAVLEAREIMLRRQCMRRLLSHSKTSKLRSAFQKWQQCAVGSMHAEQVVSFRQQILHKFLARWKARRLHAGFVQWQRFAAHFRATEQERGLKMRFLRRLFQQRQVSRLRSALRIWQEYAVAEGHVEQIAMFRRNTLRGFIMRWKTGQQSAAFAVWKTTVCERAQRDRLILRVITRLRFRHIKDALGQWQKLARTLSCARRRLLQASVRDALRHWKELVERRDVLERATRRLLSWTKVYWKRRVGLAFLRLWRHATKICAVERTLVKWCQWRLQLGWKQWCLQVMRSKAAQQHLVLEKRCALFRLWTQDQLHRTRVRKLEEAWLLLSGRASKRTERLRSQTIARMIRRCNSLRIRRSWGRWKVLVERQRLLDHLVVQAKRACDRRLKERTLRRWQLSYRQSRERAEHLVRVCTMQGQRWALRLWSASHERAVRFEGLMLQRQSRLMEESWARWRKRMQLARAAKALRARVEQVMTLKSWEVNATRLAFACLARHACACKRVARYESLVLRTGRISALTKELLQQAKVFGAWRAWKVKVRKDRQIVRALGRIDDAWTMAHAQQAFCRLRVHALNEQAGRSERHRLKAAASIRQVGDRARESLLQLQLSRSSASRF